MKKIILLLPVYNDWDSLIKVLNEINDVTKSLHNYKFECIVVNDCSTAKRPQIKKPQSFSSIKIINMKENRGHARCNAFGLRYIHFNESFDYVIVMDSDGEDRPIEIKDLLIKIDENPNKSVVAKRIKRSEGFLFQTLYQIHKFVTLVFAGRNINFGNYSCLTKKDIAELIDKKSLWSSFSGSVKKNILIYNEIQSTRGLRYFGPSKMSFFNLAIHSLSIIAVFKYTVFFRSAIIIFLLSLIMNNYASDVAIFPLSIILVIVFNLIIFAVSKRESKTALIDSHSNILNEEKIIQ